MVGFTVWGPRAGQCGHLHARYQEACTCLAVTFRGSGAEVCSVGGDGLLWRLRPNASQEHVRGVWGGVVSCERGRE